ncbi:acyl-CoA dehydrogenase family protein [Nocardia sp. CA-084685]|uniref:acyl-CoA dehydrogenase family protein n=1 Tax=Nocardia sp. CA-084685 TaxID=3239970 RepID=UPI003D980DD3
MNFELTDEQILLRDTTREVLRRRSNTEPGGNEPLWNQLAEIGLLGLTFSEADGGSGAGLAEAMMVMTEIGRALAPVPYLEGVLIPGELIVAVGTPTQRTRYLPALASGSTTLAFAHQEPGSRWPANTVATTAGKSDDRWTITGVKNPVLHGDRAKTLIVTATRPGDGIGLFLVDADSADVTRTSYRTHDGRGGAQIRFEAAEAEPLGSDDESAAIARIDVLAQGALCAEAVGLMEEVLKLTVDYLKQRKQFGTALAKFQALAHRAADMYVALELAKSMSLYATMSLADRINDPVRASRAKLAVGRAALLIGKEAIQMHGGIGMTSEYAVGHYVSRLMAIEDTLGSSDTHLRVLADNIASYARVNVTE